MSSYIILLLSKWYSYEGSWKLCLILQAGTTEAIVSGPRFNVSFKRRYGKQLKCRSATWDFIFMFWIIANDCACLMNYLFRECLVNKLNYGILHQLPTISDPNSKHSLEDKLLVCYCLNRRYATCMHKRLLQGNRTSDLLILKQLGVLPTRQSCSSYNHWQKNTSYPKFLVNQSLPNTSFHQSSKIELAHWDRTWRQLWRK